MWGGRGPFRNQYSTAARGLQCTGAVPRRGRRSAILSAVCVPGNGIGQPLEPELQELQELHELHELQALHPQRRQPQALHPQEEPLLLLVPATELPPQPQDVAADWLRQQGLQQEPATKPGKISP